MPDIRHAIQISAPAETVRRFVVTPQGLSEWWAEDVVESGGSVELGFFKRQTVYRLKIERDEPGLAQWLCESG